MPYRKISLIASISLILTVLQPVVNLPILFQVSQVLAQTPADRIAEADKLLQQGREQFKNTKFAAALQSWQQALIIYREIKDRKGEGTALVIQGVTYYTLGDKTRAIASLKQGLEIAKEINNQDLQKLAQKYLQLAQTENDPRKVQADRLLEQGNEQLQTSQFTAALQSWQQALIIYREIKYTQGEGSTLNNLGIAFYSLGDSVKAIDYYQQSLKIARQIKDLKVEGNALGNLGKAYYSLEDSAKAIDYYQQSLKIARQIKDRKSEGITLGNLGEAYYSLGDYTKAIEYHSSKLAIAREIKDPQDEGTTLNDLGVACYSLGDYPRAIDYYQQSLKIARQIKNRKSEGNALGNLGVAYRYLGNYTKAIEYLQQSLKIAREIKDREGEGASLSNLGSAYRSLRDYPEAIDYLQRSLVIIREIKDRKSEGIALGNLGNAYYSLGDYTKAIEYHSSKLAIAREIKDLFGEGIGLNNLGLALYKTGNLPEAEKTLFTGIEVLESIRTKLGNNDGYKVSIFEEQARTYRILQQVLIAQNKTNEALEISERGRSRAFVELLTSRLSTKNSDQIAELPVAKPTISLLQKIAKQQNATLVQYSIIYDDLKIDGKQQTKQSELYIWVIKPTGEITFRKSDLKPLWQKENTTLAELVTTSRESIGVTERGGIIPEPVKGVNQTKRLQQLHQLLITPIADLFPKKETERVVFIPQSELFLVPFPALQDEKGKYLIEKHTILTAPSIQVLDLTHKQRIASKKSGIGKGEILVVGNPTMPKNPITDEQLTSLPGAEREAIKIAKLLNTQEITGSKATKIAIVQKMLKARIIHFATHGLVDDFKGFGVPGAIAFASSGKDNGFLTSGEILDLKLNAELIVLSACNTGKGRITGDGVVGLSRSLISAGVPSIVVSLWSVGDDSTSLLMTEFYKNMQQKQDKATALRQAMLTTMKHKNYQSPYHWAAFTLIGEVE